MAAFRPGIALALPAATVPATTPVGTVALRPARTEAMTGYCVIGVPWTSLVALKAQMLTPTGTIVAGCAVPSPGVFASLLARRKR